MYVMPATFLSVIKNRCQAVPYSFTGAKVKVPRYPRDGRHSRIAKMVQNRMADCFTLRRRITKLKCVIQRSVRPHSSKFVPSTGSMAPWRSHHGNHTRTELDHWSDPLGTEARKHAIKPGEWCKVDLHVAVFNLYDEVPIVEIMNRNLAISSKYIK